MNSEKKEQGVVYVSVGEKYHRELHVSLESLKRHMPDVSVLVFSDKKIAVEHQGVEVSVIENPLYTVEDKSSSIGKSPFRKTIYLDTDTYVVSSLDEVFDLLDRVDFCAAHETARGYWYQFNDEVGKAEFPPATFPDVNAGVMGINMKSAGGDVIKKWPKKYKEMKPLFKQLPSSWMKNTDQASLRMLLWEAKELRIGILPTEYNALRYWGTYLWGNAVVVHGRGEIERIARQMNQSSLVQRVHLQGLGTWSPFRQSSYKQLAVYYLRFHGELIASLRDKLFRRD